MKALIDRFFRSPTIIHMLNGARRRMSSAADPSCVEKAPTVRDLTRTHLIKGAPRAASKQMQFFFPVYIKGLFFARSSHPKLALLTPFQSAAPLRQY